jgi:hypothetical protein
VTEKLMTKGISRNRGGVIFFVINLSDSRTLSIDAAAFGIERRVREFFTPQFITRLFLSLIKGGL